jgi:hypothetical protein
LIVNVDGDGHGCIIIFFENTGDDCDCGCGSSYPGSVSRAYICDEGELWFQQYLMNTGYCTGKIFLTLYFFSYFASKKNGAVGEGDCFIFQGSKRE